MGGQHRQGLDLGFGVRTFVQVLVSKRTCSGTGYDVGATVPVAVERRASVLDRGRGA